MIQRFTCLALLVLLSVLAPDLRAQAQSEAAANIVRALVLTETSELQFGSLFAGAGGSVTIAPDGTRTSIGVSLLPAGFAAGSFYVDDLMGEGNRKYSFTVLDEWILVTRQSGTETMVVNAFTTDAKTRQPWNRAPGTINVGATLTILADQMPGVYVGTYRVRVDEQ
jgi:hypothetical protein